MSQEQQYKGQPWIKWLVLVMVLALGILLLNVSKPGAEVITCPTACAKALSSAKIEPLRILSFNMLHGYHDFTYLDQRTALLAKELDRLAVDIVLLQEVPWTSEHGQMAHKLAQHGSFNYAYLRANGNRRLIDFEEGVAILSRYPLTNISFTELRPPATFFENRVVMHATVELSPGPIDLFVTHLTHGKASTNQAQVEALINFVQSEAKHPAIVAGDFNAEEDSPQIRQLANLWQDSFRLAHPNDSGATCCITNLVNAPITDLQTRIDYLFLVSAAGQTFRIEAVQRVFDEPFETTVGQLWVSDHAGLLATVTIEPQP